MSRLRALLVASAVITANFVTITHGQDVDVVGISAKLSDESSDLQEAQKELQSKRDTLKKEAAEVQRHKENVEKLKAAAQEGASSPDPPALEDAERTFTTAQETYNRNRQEYVKAKEQYDQRLRDYNERLDRLNVALPKAVQDAGAPFPTEDELEAPAGDYQVEDMEILSGELSRTTVGDGSPTAFVQEAAKLPDPMEWAKGDKVFSATIRPGTPIATFNSEGEFRSGSGSHAGIFITQNENGIWVYDQYKTTAGKQRPVDARFIRNRGGSGAAANDASGYFVVVKRSSSPQLVPASK